MHKKLKTQSFTRRFLKDRLANEFKLYGHDDELNDIKELFLRTSMKGESNSALLIGKRGSGKTQLINACLYELFGNEEFLRNTTFVYLNGTVHSDDRLAIRAITEQLQLENVVGELEFVSLADNLTFLLASLKSGTKATTKSIIFILDEFHLFCDHHKQTLLYNLFDVSQSAQSPICVLGITCRLDVIELLEKRVKSRFSHRQIFLYRNNHTNGTAEFANMKEIIRNLLMLPTKQEIIDHVLSKDDDLRIQRAKDYGPSSMNRPFNIRNYSTELMAMDEILEWLVKWNKSIVELFENHKGMINENLLNIFNFDNTVATMKTIVYDLINCIGDEDDRDDHPHQFITHNDFQDVYQRNYEQDGRVQYLSDLSILEICLLIAIKQHCEIYDREPFNFEIILTRYKKFENSTNSFVDKRTNTERTVIWKAFKHLQNLRFIIPQSTAASKTLKEFELFKLQLTYRQITMAIGKYEALPTEVTQWSQTAVIV